MTGSRDCPVAVMTDEDPAAPQVVVSAVETVEMAVVFFFPRSLFSLIHTPILTEKGQ